MVNIAKHLLTYNPPIDPPTYLCTYVYTYKYNLHIFILYNICTKIHNKCWWQKLNLGFHGMKLMPFQSNIIWFCNILCQKKNITHVFISIHLTNLHMFFFFPCFTKMKQIKIHFWKVLKGLHNIINKDTNVLNIKKMYN
jgi:hypothetical protein